MSILEFRCESDDGRHVVPLCQTPTYLL